MIIFGGCQRRGRVGDGVKRLLPVDGWLKFSQIHVDKDENTKVACVRAAKNLKGFRKMMNHKRRKKPPKKKSTNRYPNGKRKA